MALKDITLGQYFPGHSFVHKLDPRTKLLAVVLYIVALFLAKSFITYGIMFLLLAVSIAISKVPLKSIVRGLKPVVFRRRLLHSPPAQGCPRSDAGSCPRYILPDRKSVV